MSFFTNWSSSTVRPEEPIGNLINGLSYFSMFSPIKRIGFEEMKIILERKNEFERFREPLERSVDDNITMYGNCREHPIYQNITNKNNIFGVDVSKAKHEFYGEQQNKNENQKIIIINTLPYREQDCLIPHTLPFTEEENVINNIIENGLENYVRIIIYGRNCNDDTVHKKYKQLTSLGFQKVCIYTGGLFEWVLLQDIYGVDEFTTTTVVLDILRFSPNKNT